MKPGEVAELDARADELLKRSRELVDDATRKGPRRLEVPVSIQRASANRKLAPQQQVLARNGRIRNEPVGPFVVSTYVSIVATCPDTCPFRSGGCYAIAGTLHLNGRALDRAAKGWPADEVTLAEARAIDALWSDGVPQDGARGGRDMRLHVAGEVSGPKGARALADAAERWRARRGGAIWTYTHRWRQVRRAAWGSVSVLASCETGADVAEAREAGYAAAVVVPAYPDGPRRFSFEGHTAIPCPAEAGRMTCSQCRLCMDDRKLFARGLVIAFAAHGADEEIAKVKLPVLR